MTPDSLLLALVNGGATKLDYFLDVEAELTTAAGAQGTDAMLRVVVTNRVPEGEPVYVAGPFDRDSPPAGQYKGTLAVTLPGDASGAVIDGQPVAAAGPDGPTQVVATHFELPRGQTGQFSVRFQLPATRRGLWLEPAARVPALRWRLYGEPVPAESRRYFSW
jgi:hypothetical protein